MASPDPPWSDLPHHVLGLFIDRLASSPHRVPGGDDDELLDQDRARFRAVYRSALGLARFRAVCRSWRAAAREHPPRRLLPWTVLNDGSFITGLGTESHPLPSWPVENATCIVDSTHDWLALQCAEDGDGGRHETKRSYLLYNPFSGTTVRLSGLDDVIGDCSRLFKVRKVLMRSSSTSDIVAILTNNYNYPIILARPGKGVWLPRPRSAPFIYITDIVFAGDKLYGITKAEDLISLDIAFDTDGKPTVTCTKRVIRHATNISDDSNVWSDVDVIRVQNHLSPLDDGFDLWSDVEEKYCEEDDVVAKADDETVARQEDDEDRARYEIRKNTGDETISEAIDFEEPNDELVTTTWHIVESLGKLLMVKRKLQWPTTVDTGDVLTYTRGADVFEANITMGAWIPVTGGLDGQALFISRFNCRSIHASGEVQKDMVYFVDTGDVLDMKCRIISKPQRHLDYRTPMWLFPPEIVV